MTDIPCLALHPAVCAVEDGYEILLLCTCRALASVTIGETTYTDSNNGVMRTDTLVHKVRVPAAALNAARHYRVNLAPLADHCNYYPKPEPTLEHDQGKCSKERCREEMMETDSQTFWNE